MATESVNGANPITFQYDPDSFLTQAGSLSLSRHPQHGLLTATTLGGVTDSYGYSTFGELSTYQATYSGSSLLNASRLKRLKPFHLLQPTGQDTSLRRSVC